MSLEIKILRAENRNSIVDLSRSCPLMFKMPVNEDYQARFEESVESYLDPKSPHRAIGAFSNGELVSMLCMHIWKHFPFWTLTNMKKVSRGNMKTSGLIDCMNLALSTARKEHLLKFYYLIPIRGRTIAHPWPTTTFQRLVPELKKYLMGTEAVIPANTRPHYDYIWNIMGKTQYPCDLVLRTASMSHEYFYSDFGCSPTPKKELTF